MIQVTCKHLASVKGPHGTMHHIAFDPDKETIDAARKWCQSEQEHTMDVSDRTGDWQRNVPAMATNVVYDNECLVITTSR